MTNPCHTPNCYFGTIRPEAETSIIPVTWHETGIEIFGRYDKFKYRLQLVNGLNSAGFSSKQWIVGGHQGRFEQVKATDMAVVGRLDYSGIKGVKLGAAIYYGGTSSNRPKEDMEDISAPVTIFSADGRINRAGFKMRAMYLHGNLKNSADVTNKNSRLSYNLGVPRTPVAKEARAWSVEFGYNIMRQINPDCNMPVYPFLRYEEVNSMHKVAEGIFADPRFERKIVTFGLDWNVTPTVVLKSDYSIRNFGLDRYREEKTFSLALGWIIG
jgi:hypothetical protein